jgi:type VI secretion system ImpB/VipA family protein
MEPGDSADNPYSAIYRRFSNRPLGPAMTYSLQLGVMKSPLPSRAASGKEVFRLAVLGDFSGRAAAGKLETGDQLAARKPIVVDVDNFDAVLKRMNIKLKLPLGDAGSGVEIPLGSLDDFHPDQLYDNVELFSGLAGLRQRLKTKSTFAKAAAEVQSWLGTAVEADERPAVKARGSVVPVGGKLSDFARLIGRPAAADSPTPIDKLLQQIVGPHVVPAKDPQQDVLVAAVDEAIGNAMRSILHHPDFQALEAAWRGLDFLVRRLETGPGLKIVLYDISAEEFAADLSATDDLQASGLYRLLVEAPALDAQQGPISALVTQYFFEQTPPHAELLGRAARVAAAGQMALLAAIGTDVLRKVREEDVHPLVRESWSALKSLPEAAYLGLTVPRFMLRNPYGEKTDPIDRFDFEEFTPQVGTRGMLWSSGAILAGYLLGETCLKQGLKKMNLGSVLSAGEMPYTYYTDADGDQVALPCTERLLSVDLAAHVTSQRFMPVVSIRGRPEVRLGSFQSLAGRTLAGPWAPVTVSWSSVPSAAPAAASPAPVPEPVAAAPVDAPTAAAPDPVAAPVPSAATPSPATELAPASETSASSADAELDALLASLDSLASEPVPSAGSDEMDPGLAALLADL